MPQKLKDYKLFLQFFETFIPTGFQGIDANHPLLLELEEMMKCNNQYFIFGDLFEMKIAYSSNLSSNIFGINPADISPYHFFEATHPDDRERYTLGRAKLFKVAKELFDKQGGYAIISTNFRIRNISGNYIHTLFQCYLQFSAKPRKTVYLLRVHTNVGWYKKLQQNNHYYVGSDLSCFRYPDEKLLKMGTIFTKREFEIIKLVQEGMQSEAIAERLHLSAFTINTHRRNILKKSGKPTIPDLIIDLKESSLL